MNVAVVSKYPPKPEGISDYGQHVAEALAQRPEVRSLTVLANQSNHLSDSTGKVEVRRIWRPNDFRLVPAMACELARLRPDAVWFNVSLAMFGERFPALGGFLLPAIGRRLGARTVVTLHEFPNGRLDEIGIQDGPIRRTGLWAALALLHQADDVCVTVAAGRRQSTLGMAKNSRNVWHVPLCGYDEPTLAPLDPSPTILVLTSYAPHKNIPILLTAFERLRECHPDARLILAGIDHPRFPGFLSYLHAAHGDLPGVEWRGPVAATDVPQLFRRARIVVAPYAIATGSSATIHQAIGVGRPVVVTDLPEFRAIAEEEDLWLEFFPRHDSGRLAEALGRLLANSERSRAIAEHNHRSALRYSLQATTDVYLKLLAGSRPSPVLTASSPSQCGAQWQSTFRSP